MYCVMCTANFHSSCLGNCTCTHETSNITIAVEDGELESDDEGRRSGRTREPRGGRSSSGRRDATLKDQQSTGRKRAAKLYPLNREAPCEWRNKTNCGGGARPVIGCLNGNQQARHHGPDKSVSNNEEGNVHRICHSCHYRWHRANDPSYDWNDNARPSHSPLPMSPADFDTALANQVAYEQNKDRKLVKD